MGSALGPVLANIILTEFEKTIVSNLIKSGTIKFYRRYVDDTLALIKPSDISTVLEKFNSFDKNLQFTVDTFSDGVIHFLVILISTIRARTLVNTLILRVLNHSHTKLPGLSHYFTTPL